MRVVVVGAGEVGYNIADILSREGNDIIIIDKRDDRLKNVSDNLDVETIKGSGSSPENLRKARLEQSEMIVAVTDSDETNIVACLIASTQSKVPLKIARIRNPDLNSNAVLFDKQHLNIDLCINPEREAVSNAVNLMDLPGAAEVIDFAQGRIKLMGLYVDSTWPLIGKNLQEIKELYGKDLIIGSITRTNEQIIPSGKTIIMPKDYLFVFAETSAAKAVLQFFGKETESPRKVFIFGGGNIALMLAVALEAKGIDVKIIEKSQEQCDYLVSRLNKTIVLHGDGTSQELLREENIQDADFVFAVTDDEEANILGALLAKQLGAKKAISLINRIDYTHLVPVVGIDGVMNPRHATIGKILHFIRKGKIIAATPLSDEKAEAVEFVALETSDIVNQPLEKLKLPKGTIIGALFRDDTTIIPKGNTIIQPGDHVILVTLRSSIPQLEKILTVKLDYF